LKRQNSIQVEKFINEQEEREAMESVSELSWTGSEESVDEKAVIRNKINLKLLKLIIRPPQPPKRPVGHKGLAALLRYLVELRCYNDIQGEQQLKEQSKAHSPQKKNKRKPVCKVFAEL